eukprot:1103080-Alexandrium_andersonii.AAC.1
MPSRQRAAGQTTGRCAVSSRWPKSRQPDGRLALPSSDLRVAAKAGGVEQDEVGVQLAGGVRGPVSCGRGLEVGLSEVGRQHRAAHRAAIEE